jgi:hypothetical protein
VKSRYSDILSLTDESPQWYDENGTPRYAPFEPSLCPDIYSNQVVLAEIRCQSCGQLFQVEMHSTWFAHTEVPHTWAYGDPPPHCTDSGLLCAGSTMASDVTEILQVWIRDNSEWTRRPEWEGKVRP